MKKKTCCVSGHRDISKDKVRIIKEELNRAILWSIEKKYTHFISGFAFGVDLMFAEIVIELKKSYDITLEAAIPYLGRMKTPDKNFQNLIKACDVVKVHSDCYIKSCYTKRNRYMVDCSQHIIVVYDGRKVGGTVMTMKYAQKLKKECYIIKI